MIDHCVRPSKVSGLVACLFLFQPLAVFADITWPSAQLLPSFSTPAQTQDLILLTAAPARWEAEGSSISHGTGRPEGDGWLCQAGIDAPNQHMVYGPYDTSLPAGPNVAIFRMKTDNNTANDDALVIVDVRDATTGAGLASKNITRKQFSVAGDYVDFPVSFTLPADGHAVEFRVYWLGGAYIKVDSVSATRTKADEELFLFASLKGVVNAVKPRIFSYEGDDFAEGRYTWLQSLGLGWNEVSDKWSLISKYRSDLTGIIVYDYAQPDTINLATTIAGSRKALIASPSQAARLTAAPYNLPILVDYRAQFTSKLAVYQNLYNNYWPNLTHKLLIGLNPDAHKAAVREYAVAVGAAVVWLDPRIGDENAMLNNFLSTMNAGATYMGWWPEEGSGVEAGSRFGIATIASDWATNLTMHSGMPRTVNIKPMPPKPPLENKIYVAFILSDGDNLQYVEHLMRKLWNNPDRGKVPMGWTLSPAMLDAMPGALNFYWQTSTDNDNLISGPSGYGYTYPNSWGNQSQLDQFVAKTEDYNRRAGFRVVTVWNTIVGGINQNVGQSYAANAPSLLGLTAQNTGGGLTIYSNKLPGMALGCNYCTNEEAMRNHIASAAAGWDHNSPRFVIIQAQPWTDVKPTNFLNVKNSLNSDYAVVRPDHIFQLIREKNGLPINGTNTSGGKVTLYQHCNYEGWSASFDIGQFNLAALQASGAINKDASSIRITPGYSVSLYQNDNFGGASISLNGDDSCLADNESNGVNFNDQISSMVVKVGGVSSSSSSSTSKPSSSSSNSSSSKSSSSASAFVKQLEAESYTSMNGVQIEATADANGGQNVGWIDAGDWMAYANVTFPASGTYKVEYRVASPGGASLSLDLNAGTIQLGQLTIPATGGWQSWQTISQTVNINAGTYSVGVFAQQGGWNFNWIKFTKL